MEGMSQRLWSIGHSTLALEKLVGLLHLHQIGLLCDVRTVPRSARHPHFSADALARSLPAESIEYRHLPGLGGWRHAAFRGDADYALGEEFSAALAELCDLATRQRTAIMCAEALWWRCHRRLIADRLLALGWEVCHIASNGHSTPHRLTPFAVVQCDGSVVYPEAATDAGSAAPA